MSGRLLKDVRRGEQDGEDELGRWLPPSRRAVLVERLASEAGERTAHLLDQARAQAIDIIRRAEVEAKAVRSEARAEGLTLGRADGLAAAAPVVELLRAAAEHAVEMRRAMLGRIEPQVVELALAAAERVVGAAATAHADLARTAVREAIADAQARVLRVRVHPADADAVRVELDSAQLALDVEPDGAVSLGGCVIDLDGGSVDMRIESRFAAVRAALIPEQ